MSTSACRSCGAPVIWCRTKSGRNIPIDVRPRADGNLVLVNGVAMSIGEAPVEPMPDQRYVSHFATCIHAAEHRRPR